MAASGIEYAQEVVGKDPMARFLGMEVLEAAEAHARLRVQVRPEYCNALSRAHGMLISAMADQCVAVAANTLTKPALLVELKVNYLAPANEGRPLIGEANALDRKRILSLWEVRITQEERLIAAGQALTYTPAPEPDTKRSRPPGVSGGLIPEF